MQLDGKLVYGCTLKDFSFELTGAIKFTEIVNTDWGDVTEGASDAGVLFPNTPRMKMENALCSPSSATKVKR